MLPDRSLPRPTFADVFADESLSGVESWIKGLESKIDAYRYSQFKSGLPDGDRTLRDLLLSLAQGTQSPLTMVSNLQTVLAWPVDDDLYAALKSATVYVESSTLRRRTIEWVMKSGMRFHPKAGEEVTFFDTTRNTNRRGKIASVDRPVAAAVVQVGDTKIVVEAERIVA